MTDHGWKQAERRIARELGGDRSTSPQQTSAEGTSADEVDKEEVLDEAGDVFFALCCFFRGMGLRIRHGAEPVVEKNLSRAAEGGRVVNGQYVKQADLDQEGDDG